MAKKQEEAAMEQQEQAVKEPEEAAMEQQEQAAKEPEAPKGPRKFWINVRKPMGTQEDGRFVSVNGKNWMIKYNTDVLVPEEVYYVLRDAARAEADRDLYVERLTRGQA